MNTPSYAIRHDESAQAVESVSGHALASIAVLTPAGPDATTTVVVLRGSFGAQESGSLRAALLGAIASGTDVEVDLSQVPFLDSTALGVLVTMQRRSRRLGQSLRVFAPGPRVHRILRITGLLALFDR